MSIRIKIFLSYFQVAVLVSKVLQSSDSLEGSVLSAFFDAQASASPLVEPEPSSNQWLDCTFSAMTANGIYFPWLYRLVVLLCLPPCCYRSILSDLGCFASNRGFLPYRAA
jgi:hypothetical protein